MTRSDMEATNARRTAHEVNRQLEDAFNMLWDAANDQQQASAQLTRLVVENPDIIEPLMKAIEKTTTAHTGIVDAQRNLRRLKEAMHEWEQGDAKALMTILGVEPANVEQMTPKQTRKKTDMTETVEARAVKVSKP